MARLPPMAIRGLVIIVVFTVLATLFVVGRFWARRARKTQIAANDYLVLAALVCTWGVTIVAVIAYTRAGSGKHIKSITSDELLVTAQIFVAFPVLWGLAVALVKLAILSLYLAIFRFNKIFERATYILMVVSACYGIAVALTGAAICHPVTEIYNPASTGACAHKLLFYFVTAVINLVIDFTIFLLPIPMLWTLHMKTGRKISLSFLFGLGLLVCIISVLKTKAGNDLDNKDIAYTSAIDWIWSVLEGDLGIICACLPVMQPVWSTMQSHFSRLAGSKEATPQRSLRSVSRKNPHEQEAKRQVEDQLYPLSTYAGDDSDTSWFPDRLDLELDQDDFGKSIAHLDT